MNSKRTNSNNYLKWLITICINTLILLVLLAVIEYISSLLVNRLHGNIVEHAILNHVWKPNSKSTHHAWIADNPEYNKPYTHHYNQQGWIENYNVVEEKPDNTYRIFYIGDSFTEGTVAMDGSVPSIVEIGLQSKNNDDDLTIEVINAGTSSYSPVLMYLLIRHELIDFKPDLIVMNVDMTDDFDDWKYRKTLTVDEYGNPLAAPPRDIYQADFLDTEHGLQRLDSANKLRLFLIENSYTFNLFMVIKKRFEPKRVTPSLKPKPDESNTNLYKRWSWCQEEWDDTTKDNVAFTLNTIERIIKLTQKNNIKLMITAVPHYRQIHSGSDTLGPPAWSGKPHEIIGEVATKFNVPYLNSYEALHSTITGTVQNQFYYKGNMHFNPRGYKLWADKQLSFVLERKWKLLPSEFYSDTE